MLNSVLSWFIRNTQGSKLTLNNGCIPSQVFTECEDNCFGIKFFFDHRGVDDQRNVLQSLPGSGSFFDVWQYHRVTIPLSMFNAANASRHGFGSHKSLVEFGKKSFLDYHDEYKSWDRFIYFNKCLLEGLSDAGSSPAIFNSWSNFLRLANHGGSHRFSTALYMNEVLMFNHYISIDVDVISLNKSALDDLFDKYRVYFFRSDDADPFYYNFNKMDLSKYLIDFYPGQRFLQFLHKSQLGSERVAHWLLLIPRVERLSLVSRLWLDKYIKDGAVISLRPFFTNLLLEQDKHLKAISPFMRSRHI